MNLCFFNLRKSLISNSVFGNQRLWNLHKTYEPTIQEVQKPPIQEVQKPPIQEVQEKPKCYRDIRDGMLCFVYKEPTYDDLIEAQKNDQDYWEYHELQTIFQETNEVVGWEEEGIGFHL